MAIPNAQAAYVPAGKLTDYLLAPGHVMGGPKALFFIAHGYSKADTGELGSC